MGILDYFMICYIDKVEWGKIFLEGRMKDLGNLYMFFI